MLPPVNGIRRVTDKEKEQLSQTALELGIEIKFIDNWLLDMDRDDYFNLILKSDI